MNVNKIRNKVFIAIDTMGKQYLTWSQGKPIKLSMEIDVSNASICNIYNTLCPKARVKKIIKLVKMNITQNLKTNEKENPNLN